jgi:hypothetical protein
MSILFMCSFYINVDVELNSNNNDDVLDIFDLFSFSSLK